MSVYLLDTNHLSAALHTSGGVRRRIMTAARAGHRLGTCVPVLCELGVGFAQTPSPDRNWKALSVFLQHIRVWPIEVEIARAYAYIHRELRAKGRVLSQVDMMLAALARSGDLVVLTTDRDFEAVGGMRTENWVAGQV